MSVMRERLFSLSPTERSEFWRRYRQEADRRVAERIHALLLLDAGHSLQDVGAILHRNPKTIKRWVKIFATQGFDTLCTLAYEGNDGMLDTDQQEQLRTWLDSEVRSTKEAIAWVEQQFAISYTESGMTKLLKRLGYSFKKPTPIPSKADVQAQAAWLQDYTAKRGR
jgi:transposase